MIDLIVLGFVNLLTNVLVLTLLIKKLVGNIQQKEVLVFDKKSLKSTLVLSQIIAVVIFIGTGGNICMLSLTPVGAGVSVLFSVIGLIWGIRSFLRTKQISLIFMWIIIFIPSFLLAKDGFSENVYYRQRVTEEKEIFSGPKTFDFSNGISLTIEGNSSVEYVFKHYPPTTFAGHDELELQMGESKHEISDEDGNGRLKIDGREHRLGGVQDIVTIPLGSLSLKMQLTPISGYNDSNYKKQVPPKGDFSGKI